MEESQSGDEHSDGSEEEDEPNPDAVPALTWEDVAEHTSQDTVLTSILESVRSGVKPDRESRKGLTAEGMSYVNVFEQLHEKAAEPGVLWYEPPEVNGKKSPWLMCLPVTLQNMAFDGCHNRPENGHFGIINTARKMRERFYFPHMYAFITARINNCIPCISKKLKPPKKKHQMHREVLSYFGQRVYVDTVGQLTKSTYKKYSYTNFLTMQDGFTRYLVAVPIKDTKTATIVDAIIENWIYKFGCMEVMHSDRGTAFASEIFHAVMKKLGVVKTVTPPYTPEGDRVERAHRVIGDLLRADGTQDPERWAAKLPAAVLAYNGSVNRVIGVSPYEAVYFRKMPLPIDLLFPLHKEDGVRMTDHIQDLQEKLSDMCRKMTEHQRASFARDNQRYQKRSEAPFKVGDKCYYFLASSNVALSRKLQKHWIGPFEVRRVVSEALVVIHPIGNWCKKPKEVPTIVNRLRKVVLDTPVTLSEETSDIDLDDVINDVDFAAEHVTYSGPEPAPAGEDGNGPNDDGGDQDGRLEPELEDQDDEDHRDDSTPSVGDSELLETFSEGTEPELQMEDENESENRAMEDENEPQDEPREEMDHEPSPQPSTSSAPMPSTSTAPLPTPEAGPRTRNATKSVRFSEEENQSKSPPRSTMPLTRTTLPRRAKTRAETRAVEEKLNKTTKAPKKSSIRKKNK